MIEYASIQKEETKIIYMDIHIILPCNMVLASMNDKVSIDNKITTIREIYFTGKMSRETDEA